jgi:hypothetical protein
MSSSADLWSQISQIAKKLVSEVRRGQSNSDKYNRLIADYERVHNAVMRRTAPIDEGATVDDLLDSIPTTQPAQASSSSAEQGTQKITSKSLMSMAKQLAKSGVTPSASVTRQLGRSGMAPPFNI